MLGCVPNLGPLLKTFGLQVPALGLEAASHSWWKRWEGKKSWFCRGLYDKNGNGKRWSLNLYTYSAVAVPLQTWRHWCSVWLRCGSRAVLLGWVSRGRRRCALPWQVRVAQAEDDRRCSGRALQLLQKGSHCIIWRASVPQCDFRQSALDIHLSLLNGKGQLTEKLISPLFGAVTELQKAAQQGAVLEAVVLSVLWTSKFVIVLLGRNANVHQMTC